MVLVHPVPVSYRVYSHTLCVCNELVSLHNRHLVQPQVGFDVAYFKSFPDLPVMPNYKKISKLEMAMSYSAAKRRSYLRAYHTLREGNLELRKWSTIQMFVKAEKLTAEKAYNSAPRAIQFRHPCFNLLVGSRLKPLEHEYYSNLKSNIGLRCVAKGLNNLERASNIVEAAGYFRNPVFLLLDHAKFDGHVREEHLKWCHRQYWRSTKDKFLRYLLHMTINNRGYTRGGIKYRVRGTRMSGDYDTALGNTLINLIIILQWLQGIKSHVLLDGDDSVVIIERAMLARLLEMFSHFERCGFSTQLVVVYDLCEVEFCRSKLLPLDPPRFARDPLRLMSNFAVSNKTYTGVGRLNYMAGLGLCEMSASAGVPIAQALAQAWSVLGPKPIFDDYKLSQYGIAAEAIPITDEARIAFYEAWGVTPTMQVAIESQITPMALDFRHITLSSWYNSLRDNESIE